MKRKIGLIFGLIMLMGLLLNTYDGVLSALPLSINPVVSATHTAMAFMPVVRNEDWTPVEREFDGVMMVLVPVGSFVMGSTQAEIDAAFVQCEESLGVWNCQREWVEREARNGDNTQTFTEPFWIDKYEVSQEQFAQFDGQKADPFEFTGDDNFPVGLITWIEAQAYCEARGG
ncbi:MAG: SUMF1/EgtB/PvdO family nonheme iron enzyme, partial [Anaerolineae bacterium]|nr:SUMF1/EgtB/PvdO family nonheme iron enzyme [Anaerolineae bacterium]